jgi:hypothetical protein
MDNITNNDFDFYGYKTFYGGIGISGFLNLSGNVYINTHIPYENWSQYHINMNAGDMQFNSVNTSLCAESLTMYTNNGKFNDYNDNNTFADWNADKFNFNIPVKAKGLTCENLTATGTSKFTGGVTFTNTTKFDKVIQGCALCAKWADLAELYKSDVDYAPGTLVKFGGSAEITIADTEANAVITNQPGLILNGNDENDGIYKGIALVGRTPVLATGPVHKFDKLILNTDIPGTAKCIDDINTQRQIIAISLGDIPDNETKLVECVVQLKF